MTVLLDDCTRPVVVDAPAGAGSPAGATPAPRSFFDGCDTVYTLPKYVAPCGPPNPNGRSLAQVVWAVAG